MEEKDIQNLLQNLGFKKAKTLTDILGLKYKFTYKHGVMAAFIKDVFVTGDLGETGKMILEISINQRQNISIICIRCTPGGVFEGGPKFELISALGRENKPYSGTFKIIQPVNKII